MKMKYFHTIINSLFQYFRQLNNLSCTGRMKKSRNCVSEQFLKRISSLILSLQHCFPHTSPKCVALFCFLSSPAVLFKMSSPDNMNCASVKPFSGTRRDRNLFTYTYSLSQLHIQGVSKLNLLLPCSESWLDFCWKAVLPRHFLGSVLGS